ncbi:MAG: type IX secretion system membrane protein PorP/SprF [Bacteroidota bacterium]
MKKIAFILILSFVTGTVTYAQQDAMYTHYMYNTLGVNPAYAGTREALTVTALHRSQWLGFPGAPVTQTFTGHTPLFYDKLGLGLSVINDKIGPMQTASIYGDFAYHFKINDKSKLSLGLKAGGNLFSATLAELKTTQEGDVAFASNLQSRFLPNFGFGAYYFSNHYYVGLSAPKLLENKFLTNEISGSANLFWEKRHFFLIGGAMFDLNEELQLKPTTLIKITNGSPIQADLTAQFIYNKKFALGAMYRTNSALGALLGFFIGEQLYTGYSFDWSFVNKTGRYNSGTHEIMIRYDFIFRDKAKIRSPRYF